MPISINHNTLVIFVPQSYLTSLGGTDYELDVNQFRLDLKDLEDDTDGMPLLDTHRHNTEVTLAGVTLARTFEIINGYTVEFEYLGSPYSVNLTGANNNISDVAVLNGVSIRTFNTAGLISVSTGANQFGLDEIFDRTIETGYSFEAALRLVLAVVAGKASGAVGGASDTITYRDINDLKDRIVAQGVDTRGNRAGPISLDVTD